MIIPEDTLMTARTWVESAVSTGHDFFLIDSESVFDSLKELFQSAMHLITHFHFSVGSVVGEALAILGFAGLILYSLQVLYHAFEERVIWGVLLLTNIIYVLAPTLGGIWTQLTLMPTILNILFIFSCWRAARQAIVMQIFSLNLFIVGILVIRYTS